MSENERQQRMIERVQEDERLRGDLPDAAATALVEWASKRVATAAAEPTRPDAEVEAEVQAIRAAARAAARAGETDPQRVLALAEAGLAQHIAPAAQPTAPPPLTEQPAPPAPIDNLAAAVGAGVAQPRPPANPLPSQEPTAAAPQPPGQSNSEQPQPKHGRSGLRRWNPFASFLKRMRGGR